MFLLWDEIRKGTRVKHQENLTYKIELSNKYQFDNSFDELLTAHYNFDPQKENPVFLIKTNGRFFQYKKNREVITLDIGFNFLQEIFRDEE